MAVVKQVVRLVIELEIYLGEMTRSPGNGVVEERIWILGVSSAIRKQPSRLPVIRPRAVDACHPLMVRYDTLSDEWEPPHDRSRFSQDCPEPGRRGRVPSRGIAGFSCKR